MIRFSCETCGKRFAIEEHLAGRKGACPKCHEEFQVPEADQAEAAEDKTEATAYYPAVDEESDGEAPGHEEGSDSESPPAEEEPAAEAPAPAEKKYIRFACEKCGKKFAVAERLAGREGTCPECAEPFLIPDPNAPVPVARSSRTDATDYLPSVHEEAHEEAVQEPPPKKKKKRKKKRSGELIRFACDGCGQRIAVARRLAGRTGNCPGCGDMFIVPDPYAPEVQVPEVKGNPAETAYYPAVKDADEGGKSAASTAPPGERRRGDRRRAPVEPAPAGGRKKMLAAVLIVCALGGGGSWLGISAQRGSTKTTKATEPDKPSRPSVDVSSTKPPEKPPEKPPPVDVASATSGTATNPPVEKPPTPPPVENPPAKPPTPPAVENPPVKPPTPPPVENPPTKPPQEDPPVKPPTPPPVEKPPVKPPTPPPVEKPPVKPPKPPPVEKPPEHNPPTKPPEVAPEEPPPDTPPPPPSNEDAKAALEDFEKARENVKGCPDAVQQARALDSLAGALDDEHVLIVLGKLLGSAEELGAVRKRAAEMLGDSASPKAVAWLARGFRASQADETVARAAISAIGRVDDAASVKSLEGIVRGGMEQESNYASYGITALGQLHRQDAVDAMLRLFGAVRGGGAQDEARKTLEQTLLSALYDCTGQALSTYDDWMKWWDANRKTFK